MRTRRCPCEISRIVTLLIAATVLFGGGAFAQEPGGGPIAPTIHCLKFLDVNADGVRGPEEPGLPNWIIYLDLNANGHFDPNGDVHALTDSHGNCMLPMPSIAYSNVFVREVMQPGWRPTVPTNFPHAGYLIPPPLSMLPMPLPLFGNTLVAADRLWVISGRKFEDRNGNGVRDDGEAGLPGWIIYLDLNTNGTFELGSDIHTVTGQGGEYVFQAAPRPGGYIVREVLKAGWTATVPVAVGGADPGRPALPPEVGINALHGIDFGNRRDGDAGLVTGMKFLDRNRNGHRDDDEPGLPDWIIYADLNRNGRLDRTKADGLSGEPWTVTGSNGFYRLALMPGEIVLREVQRDTWVQTLPGWEAQFRYVFALAPGATVEGLHFGNAVQGERPAILAGRKFLDRNGNGISEEGEPGLRHWRIYLDVNGDGMLNFGEEPATLTDELGRYRFEVGPGVHRVREVLPTGSNITVSVWAQTLPDAAHNYEYVVEVEQGGIVFEQLDFGNYNPCDTPAAIEGIKFDDRNGNHVRDEGEPALAGWLIYADLNGNRLFDADREPHDVTDAHGTYRIEVAPGKVLVREVIAEPGWIQTRPGVEANFEYPVEAVCGAVYGERNFGNRQLASEPAAIMGRKFWDQSNDGHWDDGEPPLEGWGIYLDMNRNGVFDEAPNSGEPVDIATRTDREGRYRFTVRPGEYLVRELRRPDWTQTYPGPETDHYVVRIEAGQVVSDRDFGNARTAPTHAIRGTKFADLNGNGERDPDERGLPEWIIYLDVNANDRFDPDADIGTRTDQEGLYTLIAPEGGTWLVREVAREGWQQTLPGEPFFEYEVHVPADLARAYDFGNRPAENPARLAGRKFLDRNLNGVKDGDEPGLHDWLIYLDLNGDDRFNEGEEPARRTSDSGQFVFEVAPGTYTVREVLREGWTQTAPAGGEYQVLAAAGQTIDGLIFGNAETAQEPATLRGFKFEDRNFNGRYDEGEPGLPGWLIYLDRNGDHRFDPLEEPSTLTGEAGRYAFRVPPGTHTVRERQMDGWVQTRPDAVHNHEYVVTVAAGQVADELIFGNLRQAGSQASIAGVKFRDDNRNGLREPVEPGLAGWLIYLDVNANGHLDDAQDIAGTPIVADRWTLTGEGGRYRFEHVPAGRHIVREVMRPGWVQTYPGPTSYAHVVTVPDDPYVHEISGVDFGNAPQGNVHRIAGCKFLDRDRNGEWNDGEPVLPGWPIYLDLDRNGAYSPDIDRLTHTDAHGQYVFEIGVEPASNRVLVVRELRRDGWIQTHPGADADYAHVVELPAPGVSPAFNFGNVPDGEPAGVAGRKFYDANGNGRPDPLEQGLTRWLIYADLDRNGAHDEGEPAAETDAEGRYRLALHPGEFIIRERQQPGYAQTLPGTAHDFAYKIALRPGQWIDGLHFGNTAAHGVTLQGRKLLYGRPLPDGTLDGLPGWIIYVDGNNNGEFEPHVEHGCLTGRDGSFTLRVPAGHLVIREVLKPEWVQTLPGSPDYAYVIDAEPGDVIEDIVFKNSVAGSQPGAIVGRKLLGRLFEQAAGDVAHDRRGLAGWTLYLDLNTNGVFDADTERAVRTESNGLYRLHVPAGTYTVREVPQDGWTQLYPGAERDYAHIVTIEPGQTVDGVHFVNADSDVDNDGVSDFEELLAGTSPYDSNSTLELELGEAGLIVWVVEGRVYQLEQSGNLAAWLPAGAPFTAEATGPLFFDVGPEAGDPIFYRVRLVED